jgi:hypothetical protein
MLKSHEKECVLNLKIQFIKKYEWKNLCTPKLEESLLKICAFFSYVLKRCF